jgi:DNA-binding SARP family transcriptional activator
MEFRLLGAFEVWDGAQPVEIAGSKRRALLALLVLRANEVVRSELLVDELWGERPPRNAAAALQTHVSRLRKTLGADTIASREWGYVLRAAPAEIDLRRFEGLVAEAEPLAAQQRATKLAEALALWSGPPLADLVNEPALQQDIARLDELRLSTLERRIDADLEAGQSGNLVGELEALIAQQPLREHLRWLLILALYRAGRQAEALEVYRETRRVLTEELGLEPSPALKELEQAILRQDPSLEANASPAHTEPPAIASESRRRRVPPAALLALLALGLAGTATAVALAHQQSPASTEITQAIFQTLPTTATHARTNARPATDQQKTTVNKHTAAKAAHTSSGAPTTSTNRPSLTRPTTAVAHKVHKKHTQVTPPPKPVTIADNFSDSTLDPLIWTTWSQGTGSSYAQANGQAVFSIPANPTFEPKYHSAGINIGTKCKFPGAFDARVNFSLLQWPAGNGATASLVAYQTGPVDEITRTTTQYDVYTTWPGQGSAPLADTSGSFRMTRSHGIVRNYIWHRDQWKELGKIPIRGEVWVGVSLWTFANVWQQQDVSAAFDNFNLTAPNPDCPAGSNPVNP